MKEYKVKHYHTKILGLTFEEVPAKRGYCKSNTVRQKYGRKVSIRLRQYFKALDCSRMI